ncbi:BON domain-containing protein [Cupriavidus metallidurans]|nr:BON domain-containing protein [Cupriavidus metallidurans]
MDCSRSHGNRKPYLSLFAGGGIVKVSGSVPSQAQHDIALETIRSVDGVRSIHDSLKVASR